MSIFRYNESSGVQTLDPAFSKDQARIWVANQLFNGLVQLDDNLKVIPAIAESWDISADGKIYTFRLRSDVYFHKHSLFPDSTRLVNADDFVYSFDRLLDNKLLSPGRWVLSNVDSYRSINDSIFQIELHSSFPAFLSLLSMQYCSVVPKEIVENTEFYRYPIGTGPFKFQIWEDGVKLVLRKNPEYFEYFEGNRLPFLDAISISFIKDKQAAFLQFIQGNLDFISGLDASYKDEILTSSGHLQVKYSDRIELQSVPYLNTEYLGFLNSDSIIIDQSLRRAINCGIDRSKMIKYIRNNIGKPATSGFIPMGLPAFQDTILNLFDYSPSRAKELIKESKYKGQLITLSTTSSYLDLCEYIQYQLQKIGIKVKVEVNPPSTHRQMVSTSKLDFFRGSWIADYPDSENYLSLFYTPNFSPDGPNYTHFSDVEFDSLYLEALSIVDSKKRIDLYRRMNYIISEKAAVVPLYYDQVLRFFHKDIKGFNTNAMNSLNLKKVRK